MGNKRSMCFLFIAIIHNLDSNRCPPTAPLLCMPGEACCRYSEFCYNRLCESCFPDPLNSSSLLEWCQAHGQYNLALMRNESCRFACQDRFTAKELNPGCPPERPFHCSPNQACCNASEYCHVGNCKSCFPDKLNSSLLEWCQAYGQHDLALMKNESCRFACQDRFTAEELNPGCPSERPFHCSPNQACCNASEYCHVGNCKSCFPDKLNSSLLEWCQAYGQHDLALMKNESCRFACQDRFTAEELNPGSDAIWTPEFILVFALFIMVSVVLLVVVLVLTFKKKICSFFSQTYGLCSTPTSDDHVQSSGRRSAATRAGADYEIIELTQEDNGNEQQIQDDEQSADGQIFGGQSTDGQISGGQSADGQSASDLPDEEYKLIDNELNELCIGYPSNLDSNHGTDQIPAELPDINLPDGLYSNNDTNGINKCVKEPTEQNNAQGSGYSSAVKNSNKNEAGSSSNSIIVEQGNEQQIEDEVQSVEVQIAGGQSLASWAENHGGTKNKSALCSSSSDQQNANNELEQLQKMKNGDYEYSKIIGKNKRNNIKYHHTNPLETEQLLRDNIPVEAQSDA